MSLMQRRRVAGGVDGGGSAAEERSADQMLDDLMEDLNRPSESSAAVRSVRVVEGSERAQPEVEPKRWSWLELVAHSQVITGEPKV